MSLEEIFPEDPTVPNFQYAASTLQPIAIPWTRRFIPLGTGFHTDAAQDEDPFAKRTAFNPKAAEAARLCYREGSSGTFVHHESVVMSDSMEHVEMSLAARAKCFIVSASGRGRYEKNILQKSNGITSSLSTTLGSGTISFDAVPPLSEDAIDMLSTTQADVHDRFRRKFGDYYVAAFRLGAANATDLTASSSAASNSQDLSVTVTVTVKILWWKVQKTVHHEEHSKNESASTNIRFIGFDSLSDGSFDSQTHDIRAHDGLLANANKNLEAGRTLQGRLLQTKNSAIAGKPFSEMRMTDLKAVFEAGLVVEIILLPFAKLRAYVARSNQDTED